MTVSVILTLALAFALPPSPDPAQTSSLTLRLTEKLAAFKLSTKLIIFGACDATSLIITVSLVVPPGASSKDILRGNHGLAIKNWMQHIEEHIIARETMSRENTLVLCSWSVII
jgi:hypothetical protein